MLDATACFAKSHPRRRDRRRRRMRCSTRPATNHESTKLASPRRPPSG